MFFSVQSQSMSLSLLVRLFILDLLPGSLVSHFLMYYFSMFNTTSMGVTALMYDKYPDVRVPPLQELKTQIKQIRDFQMMMDRLEYDEDNEENDDDDEFSLWSLVTGKRKVNPPPLRSPVPSEAVKTPWKTQGNSTNTTTNMNDASSNFSFLTVSTKRPMLTVAGQVPSGGSLVIIDFSRSVVQSVKTFGRFVVNRILDWF